MQHLPGKRAVGPHSSQSRLRARCERAHCSPTDLTTARCRQHAGAAQRRDELRPRLRHCRPPSPWLGPLPGGAQFVGDPSCGTPTAAAAKGTPASGSSSGRRWRRAAAVRAAQPSLGAACRCCLPGAGGLAAAAGSCQRHPAVPGHAAIQRGKHTCTRKRVGEVARPWPCKDAAPSFAASHIAQCHCNALQYFLVRAGQSEAEAEGFIFTNPGFKTSTIAGLSSEGKRQVTAAGVRARAHAGPCRAHACHTHGAALRQILLMPAPRRW